MVGRWSLLTEKYIPLVQGGVLQEVKRNVFKSLLQHSQETHVLSQNFHDDHITIVIY